MANLSPTEVAAISRKIGIALYEARFEIESEDDVTAIVEERLKAFIGSESHP